MKARWETKPVGDVCSIVGGGTPSRSNAAFYGGEIPWATIRDMKGDWIEHTEFSVTPAAVKSSATNVLPAGTVIVASRVGLGKVCRIRQDTAINQDLRGFMPKSVEQLDPQYLFLWFKSVADQIVAAGTGATVQGVTLPFLRSLQIPLPPLEEQRRIVAVLDEAFAALATATANAEKNLANVNDLFASILAHALHGEAREWETRELEAILQEGRKISYGIIKPGSHDPDGIRLIKSQQVRDGYMDLTADFRITKALDAEYARTRLCGGEILLNLVGASIGRSAVAPPDLAGANVSRAIAVIPVRDDLVPWVQYNLRGFVAQQLIQARTGGAAQPVLNLAEVKALPVAIPPVSQRDAIVRRLDALSSDVRSLEDVHRRKINALTQLRQSLLLRAFSGELTSSAAAIVALDDDFATPAFAAKIVAFAYERHVAKNRVRNFGTVKAEKILHMVEALAGIDLGRQPLREAAGPDDSTHRHATWDWARSQHFFRFNRRSGGGHDFEKLSSYSGMIEDARTAIAGTAVEKAIELLVDMDRDFAELIATTYAAWNNLIIDQCATTDADIVLAARDKWHRDKLRFDPSRFHDAIRFIRNNGVVPDGTAKRVGGQEALFF